MSNGDVREIVARAIIGRFNADKHCGDLMDGLPLYVSEANKLADVVLRALLSSGYRLAGPGEAVVPREATEGMLKAGMGVEPMDYQDWKAAIKNGCSAPNLAAQWTAMLQAAERERAAPSAAQQRGPDQKTEQT